MSAMTTHRRPVIGSVTIVAPEPPEPPGSAWLDGVHDCTADAVVLCATPSGVDARDVRALCDAARDADGAVGISAAGPVCLLVRRADIPSLALVRLRSVGVVAVRDLLRRLNAAGHAVHPVALSTTGDPQATIAGGHRSVLRDVAEQLTMVAAAGGLCSPPNHNLEIWRTRRRAVGVASESPCRLCGAAVDQHIALQLTTSADLKWKGDHRAVLCTACANASTQPPVTVATRVISPDVPEETMSALQRALMRRFIAARVARVRPLLPANRRPVVADIGGGACAFANALAAAGCDVRVFEPNPANARFADSAAGVTFIATAFDEPSVAAAGIADHSLDGMTMWHSLEHVPDPAATLALARRLLRPGGLLYICVPNLDSLQADISGERWCYADIPHHLTHFSPEGLVSAMQRAGFVALAGAWWNAEYEVFGWYESLLNVLTGSHNYFYNRAKKGRLADAGPHPRWTRVASAFGPVLLPVALAASWWAWGTGKPSCVEWHGRAP